MNVPDAAEIGVELRNDDHVALVELRRPPHNFFDTALVAALADAFEALEADPRCRAIVLAAQGSAFCAGANFAPPAPHGARPAAADAPRSARAVNPLNAEALRLYACSKPIVAAVHGAAIGGGLALALVADFRVTCAEARFAANSLRLGFHPGFGLSVTLPRLLGAQQAALLFYTARRIGGEAALAIGLADALVPRERVRDEAFALAREIAASAPLALQSLRATLRRGLVDELRNAVAHESHEQNRHFQSADFREGVAAMAARREPRFEGR